MAVFCLHLHQTNRSITPRGGGSGSALAAAAAMELSPADFALEVELADERFPAAERVEHAACLLRDLVEAAEVLVAGSASKRHVRFVDSPWEICLAADDGGFLASLYRTGAFPEVRVHDHALEPGALAAAVRGCLAALRSSLDPDFADDLELRIAALEARGASSLASPERLPSTLLQWRREVRGDAPVGLSFQALVPGRPTAPRSDGAQSDLHALLVRGRVGIELRRQRSELAPGFVFLQFERLVAMCRPLLEAWAARRAFHLRVHVGTASLAVRLDADGKLSVTLSRGPDGVVTAPALDPRSFLDPVLEGALSLAAAMVRCDRSLARNLRLRALRSDARDLRRWLRSIDRPDRKVNADPRRFQPLAVAPRPPSSELDLTTSTRLRYSPRWRAEIEGLDLEGTLLCGDKILVPGSREFHALDRMTGRCVWSIALPRAATTLAGEDVLRVSDQGEVELRSVSTGEALWSSRVAPRVGPAVRALAVSAPGVARLAVVAEADRRLVALDLRTGEARWTYASRQGGAFKLRRVGGLLVVTAGDASVTALDLATGDVIWRFADRMAFAGAPAVLRDRVAVVAGDGGRGPARLYVLGAFTGELHGSVEVEAPACGGVVATGSTVALPVLTRDGVALAGFALEDASPRFRSPLGVLGALAPVRPAVTAYDGLFVANLPSGRLVAVDADTGVARWSRTARAPLADDVPRRLDAQLRAGALFVPQSSLAVLRPRDGAVLAEVDACDLVPDLVRVDEQCALYVAEESGHVACFELGARLQLVRSV